MKKLYVYLATLFAVLAPTSLCRAANYFVPGTVWEYDELNGSGIDHETITLVETDRTASEGIYQLSIHHAASDHVGNREPDRDFEVLGNLIKVDGDKIYEFITRNETSDWYLIYDFSLTPGEGSKMWETRIYGPANDLALPRECYFKYVGNSFSEKFNTTVMELKVFRSKEESADDANSIATELWIPGVGSTCYFDGSYFYPTELIAGGSSFMLLKVTDAQGNVIVERSDNSAVETVETTDADSTSEHFDLQGRRVEHPSSGIFIEKKGRKVRKVAL